MSDYWSDRTVFGHVGNLEIASLTDEVTADFTKALPQAFSLEVTIRVAGVDVGNATVPIANGPITVPVNVPGCGSLQGRIDNWRGLDATGQVIGVGDATWSTATAVGFTLSSIADVAIPTRAIVALVPHLGWAIAGALQLFGGGKVNVTLGHQPIVLPIHRDAAGSPLPASV